MYYELPCYDSHKSFYGKAHVLERDGEKRLISYNTTVCKLDKNGNFVRLWGGYSATTMRHVYNFCRHFGKTGGGKDWWIRQEVERG